MEVLRCLGWKKANLMQLMNAMLSKEKQEAFGVLRLGGNTTENLNNEVLSQVYIPDDIWSCKMYFNGKPYHFFTNRLSEIEWCDPKNLKKVAYTLPTKENDVNSQ